LFRLALLIGESWSPGCSISSRHISVSRTRWTTSGSSMGPIRPSLPREGLLMLSWWPCTSGAAFGSASMGRWDPPSRLEGELVLLISQRLSRNSLGVFFPLVLVAFLYLVFFEIRTVFYLKNDGFHRLRQRGAMITFFCSSG
jgi:hypothetical protein